MKTRAACTHCRRSPSPIASHRAGAERADLAWQDAAERDALATHEPKVASAKFGRCFRRLHAQALIAKTPRMRCPRVAAYGSAATGTVLYLREHHFLNIDATQVD